MVARADLRYGFVEADVVLLDDPAQNERTCHERQTGFFAVRG